jgi:hypothetical protein
MTEKLTVKVEQSSSLTADITLLGDDEGSGPKLIGYLSITVVPNGVAVDGTNGKDDSEAGQMILRGEK